MKTDAASLTASCIQKWRWKNWMTPLVHFISTLQCLSLICLILSRKNWTECCFNAFPLLFPPPPSPLQHHHVMQTALHCCQRLPVQPQAPVCVSVLVWTKAAASPPPHSHPPSPGTHRVVTRVLIGLFVVVIQPVSRHSTIPSGRPRAGLVK